ncbi:mitochondrial carrier domain-containing protein [Dipodascopsis tothii]|uniref:mitochondrial carrier domain-containing protein n=1 Tax=Dipodascopsis tothii TaxID=44089 RepID=UPI0034CF0CA7
MTDSTSIKRGTLTAPSSDVTRLESIVCGGIAGLASRTFVAPLDVIKIRLQLQTHSRRLPAAGPRPKYSGIVRTATTIIREEGVRALWKGNVPASLLYVVYGSVQFSALRMANAALQTHAPGLPPEAKQFVAGAAAGAVGTAATYPLDLLRTRFAMVGADAGGRGSMLRTVRTIYASEGGVRGLFRGLGPALGQIMPYMGLFFVTYAPVAERLGALPADHPVLAGLAAVGSDKAAAGLVAGVVAKTGVFPLDLVRKRMQVHGAAGGPHATVARCVRHIVAHEGALGLYRGLWVSLIKNAPTGAVTMWTYESAVLALRWIRENQDF